MPQNVSKHLSLVQICLKQLSMFGERAGVFEDTFIYAIRQIRIGQDDTKETPERHPGGTEAAVPKYPLHVCGPDGISSN